MNVFKSVIHLALLYVTGAMDIPSGIDVLSGFRESHSANAAQMVKLSGNTPENGDNQKDVPFLYAFSLVTLPSSDIAGLPRPQDICFNEVTMPSQLSSGHLEYAWLPWGIINDARAPHGAFIYKMHDGTFEYKKVVAVSPDDPSATLKFVPSKQFNSSENTFAGIMQIAALQKGIACTNSSISYTTKAPFNGYKDFAWVSGTFEMHGIKNHCGAFVYELKSGGIVYHSCYHA
jgi:hypothetical protein